MERFLHRDHLLLGPGHRRSCGSPKIPFRSSDVDFNDVFGGPPSSSSMQDWRHGVGETVDSDVLGGGGGGGEEETISSRDPWTGRSEKPVFGEESLSRRRRQTNEFYDDIFGGDEFSSSSTPKKPGWDPASRVLSPARPLPPQTEPFLSSSLPPMLSLQGKLAKEIDFSASATPNSSPRKNKAGDLNGLGSPVFSSSTSVSRLSTQVIQGEDGSRNDLRPLYRQSSLSREFSFDIKMSPKSTKVETNDQEGLWKKKSMLSVDDSSSRFHFSIYKWANKGVPVAMLLQGRNSSRAKESGKAMNRGNEESASVSQDVEFSSISENTLETNEPCRVECEIQDNNSVITTNKKDRIDSSKSVEEVSSAISESKSITNLQSMILETPSNHVLPNVGKETRPSVGAPLDVYSSKSTVTEKLVSNKEVHKPELKTIHCLLKDDSSRQGNVNTVEQPRVKEGKVRSTHTSVRDSDVNEKENRGTGNGKILNLKKESNSSLQDSPADSEEKLVRNKVKGKVKEFVKIFNREAPVKPINNAGSGVRERSIRKAEDEANDGTTRGDMKEKLSNAMDDGKLTDTSIMDDQTLKDSAIPSLRLNSTAYEIGDTSSERKDSSLSCSGSTPESSESGIGNLEESPCADLHCQVEELSHEEEIKPKIGQNQEKIQDSDARIRQWSSGKEGNIRSLLSTLQFVLWPESGWKPVPLVDIIEGNSVKRAYQKALLCLHPDKLQQKGAAPHEKYIAEKVFDMLQEAWTHFNSLGSF